MIKIYPRWSEYWQRDWHTIDKYFVYKATWKANFEAYMCMFLITDASVWSPFRMGLNICMPRVMNWKWRHYTVKTSVKQLAYGWPSPCKSSFKSGYFEPQSARFRLLKGSVWTPSSCETLFLDLKKSFVNDQ